MIYSSKFPMISRYFKWFKSCLRREKTPGPLDAEAVRLQTDGYPIQRTVTNQERTSAQHVGLLSWKVFNKHSQL